MSKRQRYSYTAQEKLTIIQRRTASAQEKNKRVGAGKKPLYPEAKEKLKKWIIEL
ncbi:9223_t:CDS:2 [Diversispora eburnea]|uniref:9223_t:CDS:1 n=1 Tax=Diversispora eburnea TaxID=1213867 RepID=A0A9N9H6P5_9GLOM|nr:9223_t:CDS:2 [Diversispora eburnea]